MDILTSFEQLKVLRGNRKTCVTIGVFDGVHLGHKQLIKTTETQARTANLISVAVTFRNHPLSILAPPYCPRSLLTLERKLERIASFDIEATVIIPFTPEFATIRPADFIKHELFESAGIAQIICGYDFTFGHKGTGTIELLKQFAHDFDYSILQLPPVEHSKVPVKSTHIRDLLAEGNVSRAADLMTRPHEITGTVIKGNARGRTIGFPTANLTISDPIQLPARGVYICAARIQNTTDLLPAMVNIGYNPTFGENQLSIEAHILDFSEDITGQSLSLYFLDRTRDEQRFASVTELVEQLNLDRQLTLTRWHSGDLDPMIRSIPPALPPAP